MVSILLGVAVCLGAIPGYIARSKGQDFFAWWVYGAVLFPVALPHALLLKPSLRHMLNPSLQQIEQAQIESGTARKCPFCAEMIKVEAKICRFCWFKVPPVQSTAEAAEQVQRENEPTMALH